MKVQIYREGPPRVFATREHYMVCELNATGSDETEVAMRKLGWRRTGPWEKTSWGLETTFRRVTNRRTAQCNPQGTPK
jgi:hypothetical protein